MARRALIVFNPAARSWADPDVWLEKLVHELSERGGYDVVAIPTGPDHRSSDLAQQMKSSYDLVIAAGGDGTVCLTLAALAESGSSSPAAIFPLGTINVYARNLGIVDDNIFSNPFEAALRTILYGSPVSVDLGVMNGKYFSVAAGVGPLADAFVRPAREDKTNFRLLAYWGSVIQTVGNAPVVFKITTGETIFTVAASGVFVVNVEDLGFGKISDLNRLSDGFLDIVVANPANFKDYLDLGFRFGGGFEGGNGHFFIRKCRGATIEVVPVRSPLSSFQRAGQKIRAMLSGRSLPLPPRHKEVAAMIDGEVCGTTPLDIRVAPRAVNVMLPPVGEHINKQPSAGSKVLSLGHQISSGLLHSFGTGA